MVINAKTLHYATDYATWNVARNARTDQFNRAVRLLQRINEVRKTGVCHPTIAYIVVDCARKQARIRGEGPRGLNDFPANLY